jgi:hypothetical protein
VQTLLLLAAHQAEQVAGLSVIVVAFAVVTAQGIPRNTQRLDFSLTASADLRSRDRVLITEHPVAAALWKPSKGRPFSQDQARSKRSAFMTLFQAATKSCTNFPCASSCP